MEIQYNTDTNDYYTAQQYICRSVTRNSYLRFLPIIIGGAFGFCFAIGVLAIIRFYDKNEFINFYELNWGFGLIALGLFALIFGLRAYNRAIRTKIFNPEGLYRSPHTISITDDNLVIEVKENKYIYSYGDILRIDDDQNYVYVFIDNGAALYIPTMAFATTEAKMAFVNELSTKIIR